MLIYITRILAIALGRLRMTFSETNLAFRSILTAMYGTTRSSIPLATKYNHHDLESALLYMIRRNCKQHERGLCNGLDKFSWCSTGMDPYYGYGAEDENEDESEGQERPAPESYLCQT